MDQPNLILASSSPRRASLLADAGYRFSIIQPPLREPQWFGPATSPAAQAEALSYFKANSVLERVRSGLILGADTVVSWRGRVYGKPVDEDDARRILTDLAGTRHDVISGVTLLDAETERRIVAHDVTAVTMRVMTADELDRYLAGGGWRGKAGAYGIQDEADANVETLEGSFTNVVGLPMELLATLMDRMRHSVSSVPNG